MSTEIRDRYTAAIDETFTSVDDFDAAKAADAALSVRDEELKLLRDKETAHQFAVDAEVARLAKRLDRTEAERDALIDEVKTLQADLEEFGEAQKTWVQFRRERDALKAAISDVLCRMATTRAWAYRELSGDARSNVHRVIDHLWGVLDPDRSIHPALAIPDGYEDALKVELAEARAAIERAKTLCEQAQQKAGRSFGAVSVSAMSGEPITAEVAVAAVLAALDAPQRPEDTREEAGS